MAFSWLKKIFTHQDQNPQTAVKELQNQQLAEWNNLFADIKNNMHKSVDDPDVQKLVDRWEILMKKDIHENNISASVNPSTMIVPEGIREYAAEFADPSAFIQKAIAFRYNKK